MTTENKPGNAYIDEVRIYNRVLTAKEISTYYSQKKSRMDALKNILIKLKEWVVKRI